MKEMVSLYRTTDFTVCTRAEQKDRKQFRNFGDRYRYIFPTTTPKAEGSITTGAIAPFLILIQSSRVTEDAIFYCRTYFD